MGYTIHELHEQLVKKEISAVELTKKIMAHRDAVEGDIHAYLSTSDKAALETAARVDEKIAKGEEICASKEKPAPLHPKCWNTGCLPMTLLSLKN